MKNSTRKLSVFIALCMTITAFAQTLSFSDFSSVGKALFQNDVDEDILGIEENSDESYYYPDKNIKEGSCGTNAYWSFNEANGVLTVSGSGEMEYFPEKAYPHWYFLRDEIKTVEITENVTSVSENAFAYCKNLQKAFLGEKVSSVGNKAFRSCISLEEFVVDEGNETYKSIDGLLYSKDETKLIYAPGSISGCFVVPNSVNRIAAFSFAECINLEAIIIPSSVSGIEYGAFSGCTSLKNVNIPKGNIVISPSTFNDCISLSEFRFPEGTTLIQSHIFKNCPSLKNVYIPNSVKEFSSQVLVDCENATVRVNEDHPTLYSIDGHLCKKGTNSLIFPSGETKEFVSIPEGVEEIANYAFFGRNNIKKISFPKTLKTISNYAFSNCKDLSEIYFEEGTEEIKSNAFSECSSLQTIIFPQTLKNIEELAFWNCSSLKNVYIPNNMEDFYTNAFLGCDSLNIQIDDENAILYYIEGYLCKKTTNSILIPPKELKETVIIPEGIEEISNNAFLERKEFKKVVFPKSLKTIHISAFKNCTNLNEVYFEEGIKEIKGSAFKNCSVLKTINFPKSLKYIGSYAFYGCPALDEVTLFSTIEAIEHKALGYELCACGLDTTYSITFYVEKGSVAEEYALNNHGAYATKYIDVSTFPDHKYYLDNQTLYAPNIPLGEKVIDMVSYFDSLGITIQIVSQDRYISTGDFIIHNEKIYTVSIKSDVNGDASITSTDYLRIKSYFLKRYKLIGAYFNSADIDCDGEISSTDYLNLKKMLLKEK